MSQWTLVRYCTVFCIHSTELYESAEVDSRKAAVSKFNEVSFKFLIAARAKMFCGGISIAFYNVGQSMA